MYEIKPTTIRSAEHPKMLLLLTLLLKEHAIRIAAPTKTNIKPRFFNKPFMCVYFNSYYILSYSCHKEKHNSLTGEIICAKKLLLNRFFFISIPFCFNPWY